jgi:uncharacterized protein YukE
MARIRVNTEDLKNKAKDFDSAADAFKRAGDEIIAAAMAMPSYDGQLSGPARKAGYEIQKQSRELSTALTGNAESLRKAAKAFEEVDNQAVSTFNDSNKSIIEFPLYPLLGKSKGRESPLYRPIEPPGGEDPGLGYVSGSIFISPGGIELDDDAGDIAGGAGWPAWLLFFGWIVEWVDNVWGHSDEVIKRVVGEKAYFLLKYFRTEEKGLNITSIFARNNSKTNIIINYVIIEVNGQKHRVEVEGAPIIIKPGQVVDIQLIDPPQFGYFDGATVMVYGRIPTSEINITQILITLEIPPVTIGPEKPEK